MNLTRLNVFVQVAHCGSMAAAADLLHLTPSAVSQQMTRLEQEVGTTLLIRDRTGIELTTAGRALHARALGILSAVRDARAELDSLTTVGAEQLRFGSAIATVAAQLTPRYRAAHPDVRVHVTLDKSHRLAAMLRDRMLDIAVVFEADRPVGVDHLRQTHCQRQALALEPLYEEEFCVLLPEGHRLAGGPVTARELAREPLVASELAHGMTDLAQRLRAAGLEPAFRNHWSFDYHSLAQLVLCGEGVGVVPPSSVPMQPGLVLQPLLEVAPRRSVLLAEPSTTKRTEAARHMRRLVLDALRERPAPQLQAVGG